MTFHNALARNGHYVNILKIEAKDVNIAFFQKNSQTHVTAAMVLLQMNNTSWQLKRKKKKM